MRISDWSSDVCSSDLSRELKRSLVCPANCGSCILTLSTYAQPFQTSSGASFMPRGSRLRNSQNSRIASVKPVRRPLTRSEEHTSELQSLMRISYAVFCLKKQHAQYLTNNNQKYNHYNKSP